MKIEPVSSLKTQRQSETFTQKNSDMDWAPYILRWIMPKI